jgi:hypothetical protein
VPTGETIGRYEVREVHPQLVVAPVVKAFDGRFLNRAVRSLDLTVGPRIGLVSRCSMSLASQIMTKRIWRDQAVLRLCAELDAVVGQDRVDAVGHGFQRTFEEIPSRWPVSIIDELGNGELAGAVDADEQV